MKQALKYDIEFLKNEKGNLLKENIILNHKLNEMVRLISKITPESKKYYVIGRVRQIMEWGLDE